MRNRIRQLRKQRGLTQAKMSQLITAKVGYPISSQAISKYETEVNDPDLYTLFNIAKFFGVTVDYLYCCGGSDTDD